ncbi:MarR family transcriptional regulator [Rhodobacter sp. NTK016B]|nr:MarR family transcriptional regulator [Rhodobacter sp. NTK016B]
MSASTRSKRSQGARPRLIYLVNNLNLLVRRMLDERLKPHNLGGLQYTILTLIRDRDGISSAELSRRFFVTPQTMNESVTALERRGLIARKESEANRRILIARVLPEGLALLETCDKIADEVEAEVFADLPADKQDVLHDLLRDRIGRLMQG